MLRNVPAPIRMRASSELGEPHVRLEQRVLAHLEPPVAERLEHVAVDRPAGERAPPRQLAVDCEPVPGQRIALVPAPFLPPEPEIAPRGSFPEAYLERARTLSLTGRRRQLAPCLAALAAGAGLAFAVASAGADAPMSASTRGVGLPMDNGSGEHRVTIAPGGTVASAIRPGGNRSHNVVLQPTPTQHQTSVHELRAAPSPAPAGPGWTRELHLQRLPAPTPFHCQAARRLMAATIQVAATRPRRRRARTRRPPTPAASRPAAVVPPAGSSHRRS